MSVPASYIAVIVIWSTTPLAIQWSGEEVGYQFGVAARMVIGLALLLMIIWVRRLPLPFDKNARTVYLLGGIPLFIAMSNVYWSARFIPSGWISVIFGLTPIVTSLLAVGLLNEQAFAGGKWLGMVFGLAGLIFVFHESIGFSGKAWMGVAGILVSVIAHSVSAVLLKRVQPTMSALSITAGCLLVATPLYLANMFYGAGLPVSIPKRSLYSILYLAIVGTAIGFPLYFYLLTKLNAGRLALITLITPVTALLLGAWLNNEVISFNVWIGTACIIIGLWLYEFGQRLPLIGKLKQHCNDSARP